LVTGIFVLNLSDFSYTGKTVELYPFNFDKCLGWSDLSMLGY
jgi:hypothetical protein